MKTHHHNVLLAGVFTLFSIFNTLAQPLVCDLPVDMTPICSEACVICDIDGFTGRHDSDVRGETPPGFCVFGTENAQWLAFQAGSTSLSVDLSVSNCDNSFLFSGIQVSFYESSDCENFTQISNCIGGIFQIRDGQTRRLTTFVDLEIGQYYYIVMDGASGDNCDWTFNVVDGSTEVDPLDETGEIILQDGSCINTTVDIDVNSEIGVTDYVWELDDVIVSEEKQFDTLFTLPGVYELCVTGSNICNEGPRVCDSIRINDLPFGFDTTLLCELTCVNILDSLICDSGNYTLLTSSSAGCDSLVFYTVLALDSSYQEIDTILCAGDVFMIDNQMITDDQVYRQLRFGTNGCDSTVVFNVVFENSGQSRIDTFLCQGDTIKVNGFEVYENGVTEVLYQLSSNCDSVVEYSVNVLQGVETFMDTFLCNNETIILNGELVSIPGTYLSTFLGSNSCDSTVIFTVTGVECEVLLGFDTIANAQCFNDLVEFQFELLQGFGPFEYFVTGSEVGFIRQGPIAIGEVISIDDQIAQTFFVQITDGRNLVSNHQFEMRNPPLFSLQSTISDFNGFGVSCSDSNDGSISVIGQGGVGGYSIFINGDIVNATTVKNLMPGQYNLLIQDALGCEMIETIELLAPPPLIVSLEDLVYFCDDEILAQGSISFESAIAISSLQLGGEDVSEGLVSFKNEGIQQLLLIDENGCRDSTIVDIQALELPEINLPNEVELIRGDSIQLGQLSITLDGNTSSWLANDFNCSNCDDLFIVPPNTEYFTLILTSEDGCQSIDSVLIVLKNIGNITFPNAFSPNDDRSNDYFKLDHPNIKEIISLSIFDRWGQLLHQVERPPETYLGWDGRYNGTSLSTGVYVWVLRYSDFDSPSIITISGDVSLLR